VKLLEIIKYKEIYLSLIISFVISLLMLFFGEGKFNLSNKNIAKVKIKHNTRTLINLAIKDCPIFFCLVNLSCILIKYI